MRAHIARSTGSLVSSGPGCRVELVTFDDWLHAELREADFGPDAWQRSRSAARQRILALLKPEETCAADAPARAPYTLIIADDNNHLRSMRHELFQAARDHGAAFLQLHVPVSLQDALARNRRRSGVEAVPEEALRRMAAALEPPSPERFAWEAATLALPGPTAPPGSLPGPTAPPGANPCTGAPGAGPASAAVAASLSAPASSTVGLEREAPTAAGVTVTETAPVCSTGAAARPRSPDEAPRSSSCPPAAELGAGPAQPSAPSHPPPDLAAAPPAAPYQPSPELLAALCEALWRAWGPAPPPLPSEEELAAKRAEGQLANAHSYLHGLDLRTRKALGEAVAAAAGAARAAVAQDLNERRRALLAAAREALGGGGPSAEAGGAGEGGSGEGSAAAGRGEGAVALLVRLEAMEAEFMAAVVEAGERLA
ncbi:hypothetical protein HYH03_006732 [Edaphochlamys debaryana]|uniref:Uncharacterized protein n=1 Tax=Edaphochlamys debaryana TaxID=47281 RepID=A0A835Y232_9CHLO|nr:hypothetical protein HYH03_006732 [Edaphochlamys debaryana]|eukprot:KAG2495122.1 hypothetical protein HYH03_006732 [Edaphochlamys debaryana]